MKKSMLALIFGSALVLAACGGNDEDSSGASTQSEGEKITMQNCTGCHAGKLQGMGNTPNLNKVGSRLSEAEILDVIENGTKKGMQGGLIKGEEYSSLDVMFYQAMHQAEKTFNLEPGDNVVLTGGRINGSSGNTDTIKVETVK